MNELKQDHACDLVLFSSTVVQLMLSFSRASNSLPSFCLSQDAFMQSEISDGKSHMFFFLSESVMDCH